MTDAEFDRAADDTLHALERALSELDPDEVDAELSSGVLTLTLADRQKVIINSHRAARQIWMAAFRQAWHFSPVVESGKTAWKTERDELYATLARLLGERLGRPISV
jgi:CyaY protein